jgi:hypothetical protein
MICLDLDFQKGKSRLFADCLAFRDHEGCYRKRLHVQGGESVLEKKNLYALRIHSTETENFII